jgi:hypothetical protein
LKIENGKLKIVVARYPRAPLLNQRARKAA